MSKKELYEEAKQAYYEGNPIMGDAEFDELEKEISLENTSPIGSTSPNYTIPHPFIMGSLSKVQIKEDESGHVNWFDYGDQVLAYLKKSRSPDPCIMCVVTPKFDGCSFEYHYKKGVLNISGRGDGNYGQDITNHLFGRCSQLHYYIPDEEYVLRGEVLVSKKTFEKKYAKDFANPRAFVAGILNRKYEDIVDKSILNDLSMIIYDYHVLDENGEWKDYDWMVLQAYIPQDMLPEHYKIVLFDGAQTLKEIYDDFDAYREKYDYALDGIVIKPTFEFRNNNLTKERPDDCVAIKFKPMIVETTVTNIEWQLGKTGKYTPVVCFEPFMLDGKEINKATGHNYGNLVENRINVGTKIRVSLAGDIIPFIYDVVDSAAYKPIQVLEGTYVDGCNLMKEMNPVEKMEVDFLASCKTLNIFGLGDQIAQKIFDSLEYKVEHIFFVDEGQIQKALNAGDGKTADNIINAIRECKSKITLDAIITSMNIPDCGPKCAFQCARKLTTGSADFSGLSNVGWQWCVDGQLPFGDEEAERVIYKLGSLIKHALDLADYTTITDTIHIFDKDYQNIGENDKIKVILTGPPSHYKTKKDFLVEHPEYAETTKWKECKILFTGDINSVSSKMKKAKKLNIEIKEY